MAAALLPDNSIVAAIKALYGTVKAIDSYLDELIASMRLSANQTIAQAGRVIEAAKFGFGIGYIVPVAVIAIGQMILGNPLAAAATIVTSPVNPVAMTCAAIGAIYYGWSALSEDERNGIVERLANALEVGIELLKSIVTFVIAKAKELSTSESLDDFKKFVGDAAHYFGRSLADVTHSVKDKAATAFGFVAEKFKREQSDETPQLPRLPL
jgi:hypothetical protein